MLLVYGHYKECYPYSAGIDYHEDVPWNTQLLSAGLVQILSDLSNLGAIR